MNKFIFSIIWLCWIGCHSSPTVHMFDVLVIGEGTGAVSASISAARNGAKTAHLTPLPWVGGMLTSAGVSATDGNHHLHSGIWNEFRSLVRAHYGGADSIATGWVSHTMFEPKVGEAILKKLYNKEKNLHPFYHHKFLSIKRKDRRWEIKSIDSLGEEHIFYAHVVIDGTDLGDVAAAAGATFDVGLDNVIDTNTMNNFVQDLTYVCILEEVEGKGKKITKPSNYNPELYRCSCLYDCPEENIITCKKMMGYGRLPGKKYMINWPNKGNDYYSNVVHLSEQERQTEYNKAKEITLGFVYYIQQELGFENLQIAEDEFPTEDKLPLMPYHREGRRIKGLNRLEEKHISDPFKYGLFSKGIAVGDYPIDHHHDKNLNHPKEAFSPIPSFNVPLGALLPQGVENMIVADKAISVSHVVNGTTRLQPIVLLIGEAAGVLAALSVQQQQAVQDVSIRMVQQTLLHQGAYIMPYIDTPPTDPAFEAIQKVGATGVMRGKGIPYQWANQTWFYPDSMAVNADTVFRRLCDYLQLDKHKTGFVGKSISLKQVLNMSRALLGKTPSMKEAEQYWVQVGMNKTFSPTQNLTRRELALWIDFIFDPFHAVAVVH